VTLLAPQPDGITLPTSTDVSRPFWDGCARGELLYQRSVCGRIIWIPEAACRWCGSDEYTWERGAGRGEVYSWSVAYRPVSPAYHAPYAAVIVALDEGYRILSNLVGCDVDEVRDGLRVRVRFHAYDGGITLPLFEPDG